MSILIAHPILALVPAVIFALLWWWTRSALALISAVVWTKYAIYEHLMQARVLCSGECNIRVDLLFVYPALALLSVVALAHVARSRKACRGAA